MTIKNIYSRETINYTLMVRAFSRRFELSALVEGQVKVFSIFCIAPYYFIWLLDFYFIPLFFNDLVWTNFNLPLFFLTTSPTFLPFTELYYSTLFVDCVMRPK